MKVSGTWFIPLCTLAACGDPGSLDGSVEGHKITLHSAIFASYTMSGTVIGTSTTVVGPAVDAILTDDPNACSAVKSNVPFSSAHTYLFMHLNQPYYTQQGASAVPPVSAGYYSAQSPLGFDSDKQGGSALFYFKVPGCPQDNPEVDIAPYALEGGILVNDVSPSAGGTLNGDVDIKVGAHGDALKGSIHAQYCTALETLLKQDLSYDPSGWACQ